jgi:hypothetical protein
VIPSLQRQARGRYWTITGYGFAYKDEIVIREDEGRRLEYFGYATEEADWGEEGRIKG